MSRLSSIQQRIAQRKHRVRAKVIGTTERPRLAVRITNSHIICQVINDAEGKTIAYATTVANKAATGTMTEKATIIGKDIAKKAIAAKVSKVCFDRGSKLYHGRIKALAEAARAGGLEF
jgi:large subunit ribosomal protein L18